MWDNLGGYVDKTVAAHHRCVKEAWPGSKPPSAEILEQQAVDAQQAAAQATAAHAENRSRVVRARQYFEQVQTLKAEGKKITAIITELGLAPMTVRKYYHAENVESLVAVSLAGWPSKLDEYKPHLHQRWNAGCTNIQELHREITKLGYRGSYGTVYAHLAPFKGAAAPPAVCAPPKVRHVTGWIRRRPDNLDTDEQLQLKDVLVACPHLATLHGHVKTFAEMMTQRRGAQDLDTWLAAVRADDLPYLHTFANGIQRDHTAVLNGLTLPYSSGAVEGNVNRIKMLKRQMFGRANFDLLRARILNYN
ncbi:MAG: transposase family protein [Actinomycetia bacterium]|nr:transposase family protein [Actinomycetes bacterium]